jgi:hypothetical protein
MKSKKQRLESAIAMGKWRFVFWRGMVFWGIPTAFLTKLMIYFISGTPFFENLWLWLTIYVFIGGTLFGLLMWHMMNRQYKKQKHEEVKT